LDISENIITVIKLRRMRLTKHAARMKEMRNAYTVHSGNLKGRYQFGDMGIDTR
jgi:hypothetical protein